MLTQGYRRFSYDNIISGKFPSISYIPEAGIDITGTLRASNGIPVKGGNVRLLIADKNYSENAVTDADGRFSFSHLVFSDSTKVNISARNNPRSSDLVLTVGGETYQKVPVNYEAPDEIINIDSVLSSYLQNSKVQYANKHILKEVVIKDTKIVQMASHKDYGSLNSLSNDPDHVIPAAQLRDCPDLLGCLTTLASGMTFDNGNFYVTRDYNQGQRIPAQIFLRGAPVDINALSSINPKEIESVEIFTKDELGLINNAYGTDGVLVINMHKVESTKISLQQLKDMIPQKNEITFTPKGYAVTRVFYMPRYEGPVKMQTTRTDTRSTIYWNPDLVTDKTGVANVEFYNADGRGTYRVIIEGFDKDGDLGRQVYRYTVQ